MSNIIHTQIPAQSTLELYIIHHYVNVTHGRSQGQIFTEANTVCSLRPRLAMLLNVVYADIKSCPYLIEAGGCNTV